MNAIERSTNQLLTLEREADFLLYEMLLLTLKEKTSRKKENQHCQEKAEPVAIV